MRRSLVIVALGISFLILITALGTIITSIIPHKTTAQVQTTNAGPYTVTLQVNPNPPSITDAATLSIQVTQRSSQHAVSDAHVSVESDMQSMDMGIEAANAQLQSNGTYIVHVQFSMGGTWRVQTVIAQPGSQTVRASFEVTAQ